MTVKSSSTNGIYQNTTVLPSNTITVSHVPYLISFISNVPYLIRLGKHEASHPDLRTRTDIDLIKVVKDQVSIAFSLIQCSTPSASQTAD